MEQDELLARRIRDLANTAERKGCICFSDFLNLNEQNIYYQTIQKFSRIHGETFGGYEGAERTMAAFIPETLNYSESFGHGGILSSAGTLFPIACVKIVPRAPKFAEKLGHRDILGALLSLGIDRGRTGDIAIVKEEARLFCADSLADLICRELTRIRHTDVICSVTDPSAFSYAASTKRISGAVSSIRLDALLALGFQSSRSSLLALIEGGRVFVNGKLIMSNAYSLRENDIVSVRGKGRFRYLGAKGQSKKGRYLVEIDKFE